MSQCNGCPTFVKFWLVIHHLYWHKNMRISLLLLSYFSYWAYFLKVSLKPDEPNWRDLLSNLHFGPDFFPVQTAFAPFCHTFQEQDLYWAFAEWYTRYSFLQIICFAHFGSFLHILGILDFFFDKSGSHLWLFMDKELHAKDQKLMSLVLRKVCYGMTDTLTDRWDWFHRTQMGKSRGPTHKPILFYNVEN